MRVETRRPLHCLYSSRITNNDKRTCQMKISRIGSFRAKQARLRLSDLYYGYYLKVYQVIIHVSNCPGNCKAQEATPNENSFPFTPAPAWHKKGWQTWMASQIVVLSVLGQDLGPFFPLSSLGSRFTVSINQGSFPYLKSLSFSTKIP